MQNLLLVMVGGALGSGARYGVNVWLPRVAGGSFPWHTVFVNIAGSFLMGALVGWLANRAAGDSANLRLLLATGVLGGFTTFSAFSLDFVTLWQRGEGVAAFGYVVLSVVASLAAIFAGLWLVRTLM